MKNVFTNTMKTMGLIAALSFTACTNVIPSVSKISEPSESQPIVNVDKTVQALNAMQSVSIVTCANGTKGLRVVDVNGNTEDVACGGDRGLTGATGAQGPQGIQGVAGVNGADGAVGPQGPAGASGAKRFVAYNNDGTATGMTYVSDSGMITGEVKLYQESTGLVVNYGMPNHATDANTIRTNATTYVYYATSNCTGQMYGVWNVGNKDTLFKLSMDNKYYKTTGVSPATIASRWNGTACDTSFTPAAMVNYTGFTMVGTGALPAGIPLTIKAPLKIVLE